MALAGWGAPGSREARYMGKLDWELRYKLMRTHTAFHILCGVVWRDWKAQVTGGNMEPSERAHGLRVRDPSARACG